tara:strand:- start:2016 stop:2699 length:684 start_codon:yes stop_codon:yes gene_type:complete
MKKTIKHIALATSILLTSNQAMATLLTGGDFSNSCNVSDWDQFGNVSVSGTPGNCAATLSVNDTVDFEAELSQGLSLVSGVDYLLNINFSVDTTLIDSTFDDEFSISLFNQDFDYVELFSMPIVSMQSFTESLAIQASELSSYVNQDWSLSFYMFDGFAVDDNQSSVSISFTALEEAVTDVPEPSSLAFLLLGCAGVLGRKKISQAFSSKSLQTKSLNAQTIVEISQ